MGLFAYEPLKARFHKDYKQKGSLGRSPGLFWFVPPPKEISEANLSTNECRGEDLVTM